MAEKSKVVWFTEHETVIRLDDLVVKTGYGRGEIFEAFVNEATPQEVRGFIERHSKSVIRHGGRKPGSVEGELGFDKQIFGDIDDGNTLFCST